MERNNSLWLLVLLFLFIISLNLIIIFDKPLEVRELAASVIISDSVGFDLDNRSLTFGRVIPGTSTSRAVEFINSYDHPVSVSVYGKNGMENFISMNEFRVEGYGREDVSVIIIVPDNQEFGEYSGSVIFDVYKAI